MGIEWRPMGRVYREGERELEERSTEETEKKIWERSIHRERPSLAGLESARSTTRLDQDCCKAGTARQLETVRQRSKERGAAMVGRGERNPE